MVVAQELSGEEVCFPHRVARVQQMARIISRTVRAALFSTLIAVLMFFLGWMEEDVLFTIVYLGNDPILDLMVKNRREINTSFLYRAVIQLATVPFEKIINHLQSNSWLTF